MEVILNDLYPQEFFDQGGIITNNGIEVKNLDQLENVFNSSNPNLICRIGKYNYVYDPVNEIFTYSNLRNFLNLKDPYGIPNVNFSCINESDKRWEEFKHQRLDHGFDDSELWNLESTIAKFIYPRIKEFAENHVGYPGHLTEEKWQEILDKITKAFRLYIDHEYLYSFKEENEKIEKQINEGLRLFAKYFWNLWD